ncbi:DNA-directed RNA polymerase I subunit RPA34 [Corvus moneduloides]|uniref:DNA-directed RNA polymerase I subunit RPA34 n=1 Tax=Corvus moneduloides TaxID=1196302 RepID=UPI00136440AB|nr:DNA-directed RNA polymerase I subunit RPA34 [Corvus moneduloides]
MEGPLRFRCPPEFEAVAGGVPLGGPCTELWLIRAPADFCPQSLEGCPVPLNGLERLRTPQAGDNDNDTKLYVLRGGPGGEDCPLLLSPVPPGGALGCAPPLRGSLTITQSFGTPPGTPPRKRKKKKAKATAELVAPGDTGTSQGTMPPAGTEPGEGPGPPQVALEEAEVAKRKKKKKKKKHKGEEEQE